MVKKAVLIVLPLAVLGGLVAWRIKTKAGTQQQLKGTIAARRTTAVEAATAGPATISGSIIAAGNLDSPFKVQLTSRVAGKINSITVREGDAVTAGQVLVKIDPATALAGLSQAQANLAQAQAKLAQAKIEAAPNTANVKGQIDQNSAGLVSAQAELTQAQKTVDATNSGLASSVSDAQDRVSTSQASLTTANANLDKENATKKNLQVKVDRAKELLDKGYIAQKDLEDAQTAYDVQDRQVQVAIATVSAASVALQTSKNQLIQAKAQLSIAKTKGNADIAAAKAKVNQARSTLDVAKVNNALNPAYEENLRALRAAVSVAQADVSQAQTLVNETDLRSSINGVITARNADEGALASPGTAVLVIQSLDWLFFIASIPVEEGDKVRVGQAATIQLESGTAQNVTGTINSINPSADPQSRQIALRIKVPNPDRTLRPGMFGKINFTTDARTVSVSVPKEAVTFKGKQATVAVIGDDNKIQMRNVVTGTADEKVIEIKDGVKVGEKVVTLSYNPLKDGMEVKVGTGKGGSGKGKGGGGDGSDSGGGSNADPSSKPDGVNQGSGRKHGDKGARESS